MTVEFYDLAQRLHAAQTGQPVVRVAQALFRLHPDAILVEASDKQAATVTATVGKATGAAATAHGVDVLHALADAGAHLNPGGEPPQLVIADTASLTALGSVAHAHRTHADDTVRAASAVIGWWLDRAGYPGSGAVINLLAHSRQRFITGATPDAERHAAHWRAVFDVPPGVAGLRQWAASISGGVPLSALAPLREDDTYTYQLAAKRFQAQRDWTAPEPPPVAAMGLRARCDAADLWEAALLADRLWRHRAVHTGHVTGGEVIDASRASFTVRCQRLDARLRAGAAIVGWEGGLDNYERATTFYGDVYETSAHNGALLLKLVRVPANQRPTPGQWASLMPAPPNPRTVSMGRAKYRRLQFRPDSWIAAGKTPGIRRRDVPLDVLCAAAETE